MRVVSPLCSAAAIAWAIVVRVAADVPADRVPQLPDFAPTPFATHYDELRIHYQFHTSQRDPSSDPVAAWHNGGPGRGGKIFIVRILRGTGAHMGYFLVNRTARYVNPYAWNR
eukprot:gene52030-7139_t